MLGTIRMGVLAAAAALAFAGVVPDEARAQMAHTQSEENFTHERFAELQDQGALVLIDIFADWCPTCAIQQEVLAEYREANPDVPLYTLTIDFDTQKDLVTHFRAPRQSTLILFRGHDQLWYTVAETRADEIFRAIEAGATGS